MPRLLPCPTCHAHVLPTERSCPHCSTPLARAQSLAGPGAVVLVGLALTGCPNGSSNVPEPEYGVPDTADTHYRDDGGDLAEPEYGVPDTSPGEEENVDEPDYGVPDTSPIEGGNVDEPDYGVPDAS